MLKKSITAPLKIKLSRIFTFQITLGCMTFCSFILLFIEIPMECLLDDSRYCWTEIATLILAFVMSYSSTRGRYCERGSMTSAAPERHTPFS